MSRIETKEIIEEATKFLKYRGIVKVGSLQRYEITPDEKGVEVTDWYVTKYYQKDGKTTESCNGCTIHIAKESRKKVGKAIGDF